MTSVYRRSGGLRLDGTDAGVTETLEPLDPGRDAMLALFRQAIISELGPAWDRAKSDTPHASSAVVEDTWPGALTPEVVRSVKLGYPLLALARTGEATVGELTFDVEQITQQWTMDYVVGPLAPEDQRKLRDILSAVPRVIVEVIRRRGHPDHESGALQFFGHFASVRLRSFESGAAPFAGEGQPLYHGVSCTLETTETTGDIPGAAAELEGFSLSGGVVGTGGTLPDAVSFDSDPVFDLFPTD